MTDAFEPSLAEEHDFIAKIYGKIKNVRGEYRYSARFQRTKQVLHLFGNNDIERGEGLIEERDARLGNDIGQHLHLVFHALRKIFQQAVAVFGFDARLIEIGVDRSGENSVFLIDIQEEAQEFASCKKFRYLGSGKNVADIFRTNVTFRAVFTEIKRTTVDTQIGIKTVEKCRFPGAVAAQQTIDFP